MRFEAARFGQNAGTGATCGSDCAAGISSFAGSPAGTASCPGAGCANSAGAPADPYRWMEKANDPEWVPFMKGQAACRRLVFDSIPGRKALVLRPLPSI